MRIDWFFESGEGLFLVASSGGVGGKKFENGEKNRGQGMMAEWECLVITVGSLHSLCIGIIYTIWNRQ